MGAVLWPVPITFAIYKGTFALTNSIMSASKLGSIQDPSKWWHWLIFVIIYCLAEFIMQTTSRHFSE